MARDTSYPSVEIKPGLFVYYRGEAPRYGGADATLTNAEVAMLQTLAYFARLQHLAEIAKENAGKRFDSAKEKILGRITPLLSRKGIHGIRLTTGKHPVDLLVFERTKVLQKNVRLIWALFDGNPELFAQVVKTLTARMDYDDVSKLIEAFGEDAADRFRFEFIREELDEAVARGKIVLSEDVFAFVHHSWVTDVIPEWPRT